MEIVDYFQTLGTRCWVMILAPLLTGLVFAGIAFQAGYVYRVNALIQSPSLIGVRSEESDGNQFSTELQSTLQVELAQHAILAEISHRTGIPLAKLRSGLSVTRRKPSSFVVVAYSGPNAKKDTLAATTAAQVAYGAVVSYELQVSTDPLTSAQSNLTASQQQLNSQAQQANSPDPTSAYITDRYAVARLESSLAQHLASGNTAAAAQDQIALDAARENQAALVDPVITHQSLVTQRDRNRTVLDIRFQQYIRAENKIDASDPAKAIHTGPPKKQIPVKDITLLGGAAGGVVLAFVLFVQWVSETKRWQRLRRTPLPA